MLVSPVEQFNMQIAANLLGKRTPEVLDQLDVELTNSVSHFWHAVDDERAAAQVDDAAHQRLIHRQVGRAEANNSFLVPESLRDSLAKGYRDVLDRMMLIDVQITLAAHFHVE